MEGYVVIKYTTDQGATWSTALTIHCARLHAYLRWEKDDNLSVKGAGGHVCEQGRVRQVLTFDLTPSQFDPNLTGGDTLWIAIQKLRCASQIHLYTTAQTIDGMTDWNADNNTAYLTPDDIPDPEYDESNGEIRKVAFTLKTMEEYAI
jgi:hypothetical protein